METLIRVTAERTASDGLRVHISQYNARTVPMVHTRALLGFCAASVLLLASVTAAQTVGDIAGGIDGVISDRTGGSLAGVTIRATSPALMGARTSVSGADGVYRIPALPPGEYALTFSLPNFHPASRDGVRV